MERVGKRLTYGETNNGYEVLYTNGKEFIDINYDEYVGFYVRHSNGETYKGGELQKTSKRETLTPAPLSTFGNNNNKQYYKLTETAFFNHTEVNVFYPVPSQSDYDRGFITRYFVEKINEKIIYEIKPYDFGKLNPQNNPGINGVMWDKFDLKWVISGPIESVKKSNQRQINLLARVHKPLTNYLGDLDEFHETKPIRNYQKVSKTYADGSRVHLNLPKSYGYSPGNGGEACGNCMFNKNNLCSVWNANIRNSYWCERYELNKFG
jgi:hypothetical protein